MAPALITGGVLAGGKSRRLGRDKARAPLEGLPLAGWVWGALQPLVDECWLITNQPLDHLVFGFPLLIDLAPGRGALGGLLSLMLVAGGTHVLLAPCDTPFLQPALLAAMLDQARRGGPDAVVCRSSRGLEPLPGVFHTRLWPRLQTQVQQEDLRLRTLLDACRTTILPPDEVARHDPRELSFFNINTPEDGGRAAALAQEGLDEKSPKNPWRV